MAASTTAVVSGRCGLAALAAAGWIGDLLGVSTIAVRVVGIGLVPFAIGVGTPAAHGTGGWPSAAG